MGGGEVGGGGDLAGRGVAVLPDFAAVFRRVRIFGYGGVNPGGILAAVANV